MKDLMFLLPQDHQPVPFHRWAQEEAAWGFRAAPGELSVPSATGRMLEGGVRQVGADILEDPMLALEQAWARTEAAERFSRFAEALKRVGSALADDLEDVFGDPLEETDQLAFGGAANLFPKSQVARDFHRTSRTAKGFVQWAGDLRVAVAGELYADPRIAGKRLRRLPRATDSQREVAAEIRRDLEKRLLKALEAFASSFPRFQTALIASRRARAGRR